MNKVEGCNYDSNAPFTQVASEAARAPIYNNSLAFLIFHQCEGMVVPMSGIANFRGLRVGGEMYSCPEFSHYFQDAIPVMIQQSGAPDGPIRWGEPTGLNMRTFVYGSQNGFLVNAGSPPLGSYCDLRMTNRSELAHSTVLTPSRKANSYPIDHYVHAGDIFTVDTAGVAGKCMFSLIPYTTYYPQGAMCIKYDDNNGNLIEQFYTNPDYQAFTNPCHCNPRQSQCLNRKENFEVSQLIANGMDDVEAGTEVVMQNAMENEQQLLNLTHKAGGEVTDPLSLSIIIGAGIGLLIILFIVYKLYQLQKQISSQKK